MSGSIRGRVECLHAVRSGLATDHPLIAQEIFTNLYYTFLTHPNMSLIARNGGLGGTAANINYWDQTDPFNNNAFFVFRMNTAIENVFYVGTRTFYWYVLVQWNRGNIGTFGSAPGNPGLSGGINQSAAADGRVSVQFAIGVGGTQNPWNGTGTLGTNSKGSQVWVTPSGGSGVMVWPRSNNLGGAHNTNKENGCDLYLRNTNNALSTRAHILMDDDAFLFVASNGDNDAFTITYFGPFVPRPGLSVTYPYLLLGTQTGTLPFGLSTGAIFYGSVAGTGITNGGDNNAGGVPIDYPAPNSIRRMMVDRWPLTTTLNTGYEPNHYFSNPAYDEFPIPVWTHEVPLVSYAGQIDFIREITQVESYMRNIAGDRTVFGGTAPMAGVPKLSVPWAIGVIPGSGFERTGVVF